MTTNISKLFIFLTLTLATILYGCEVKPKPQNSHPQTTSVKQDTITPAAIETDTIINQEDTIDYRQEMIDEILALPSISEAEIDRIQPHIKGWLKYHNLNIKEAKDLGIIEGIAIFNSLDTTSLYFNEYTTEYIISNSPLLDYSPNKRKYIDLGYVADLDENGIAHYYGWDDCQSVYLTDHDKQQNSLISWQGAGSLISDVFWIDNDHFILVCEYFYEKTYSIIIYDLKKDQTQSYLIIGKTEEEGGAKDNYFEKVYLKKKNIKND